MIQPRQFESELLYTTEWRGRLEYEPLIQGDYLVLAGGASFTIIDWRLNKRSEVVSQISLYSK